MSARVHREHHSLTLYPSRVPAWLGVAVTALCLVALGYTIARSSVLAGESLAGIVLCAVLLATTGWLWFSRAPVLVVDLRGVRSPMMFQPEVVGWGRIALVRKGDSWAQNSLEVFFRADARDRTRGTKGGLHIPAIMLPLKIDTIVAEIDAIQAAATTERREGP